MQVSPLRKLIFKDIFNFCSKRGGNLYTWGITSLGSGIDQMVQPDQLVPRRVDFFNGNVAKVSTGLNASAVITTNGVLFTFGANGYGQLGLGNKEDHRTPTEVSFFRENGLRVTDVAMGSKHAVAVTADGSLWTWGCGGSSIPFLNLLVPSINALGTPNNQDLLQPTLVESLQGRVLPQTITAGKQFSIVHDANGQMWNWGRGNLGQFGNGFEEHLIYPEVNPLWESISKTAHLQIVKLKSVADGTVALMNDGNLIGWGGNHFGQLGIRQQEFVRTDGKSNIPLEVNKKYMKAGEKVIDFDLSQDNLVFYTNYNNVYFSGNDEYYVPYLVFEGKEDKIVKVAATSQSYAIVTESGDIWVSNQFVEPYERIQYQVVAKIPKNDIFNGGRVLDIGGSYNVRYAIVEN